MIWQAHPLSELHWRRWSDEWIAFDAGSGQTHRMDTLSAVALLLLEGGGAMSMAELARRLADELRVEADDQLLTTLQTVLDRQAFAGLVEAVPQ